jgi:AcrR family transcriptional regulator
VTRPRTAPKKRITRGGHVATGTSAGRRAKTAASATPEAARTRQALVDAAQRVFIQKGYLDARVSDIVKEADVAHGSFYSYFPSKREVFQEVVDQVSELISQAVVRGPDDVAGDYLGNLERANRRYLDVHHGNAAILSLVEQVGTTDPVIRDNRVKARRAHVDRIERTIRSLQRRGLADLDLDPHTTAGALASMLSSFAHWASVEPQEYDADEVVRTLTQIWARTLRMDSVQSH